MAAFVAGEGRGAGRRQRIVVWAADRVLLRLLVGTGVRVVGTLRVARVAGAGEAVVGAGAVHADAVDGETWTAFAELLRARLEVEAELAQALGGLETQHGAGAGQQPVAFRLVAQAQVGVDARVAAVADLGEEDVAGLGQGAGPGGTGLVGGGGLPWSLRPPRGRTEGGDQGKDGEHDPAEGAHAITVARRGLAVSTGNPVRMATCAVDRECSPLLW